MRYARAPFGLVLLVLGALGVGCSEEKCARGDACDKVCEVPGETATCVVDGICRCGVAPDGGIDGQGGGSGGGGNGSHPVNPACVAPAAGELLVNEIMIDPGDSGNVEFLELVNPTDKAVELSGLRIISVPVGTAPGLGGEEKKRAEFTSGCLAPRSAYVFDHLTGLPGMGMASTDVITAVGGTSPKVGYANDQAFDFRIRSATAEIDMFAGSSDASDDGESANRNPDGLAAGVAVLHSTASGAAGLKFSPGRCANGGTFEAQCGDAPPVTDGGPNPGGIMPPPGGNGGDGGSGGEGGGTGGVVVPPPECLQLPEPLPAVIINEVLANTNEAHPEEFIEIVNTTAADIVMDGWVLFSTTGAGAFDDRLSIGTGVLPAHGVVGIIGNLTPENWIWDPAPAALPTVTKEAFSLLDSGDPLRIRIADAADVDVATLELPKVLNKDGKSATRCLDIYGSTLVLHDSLGGPTASPGRCSNGGLFSQECLAPAPGSMP